MEEKLCHRCMQSGLAKYGIGPCTYCGWNYDDGVPRKNFKSERHGNITFTIVEIDNPDGHSNNVFGDLLKDQTIIGYMKKLVDLHNTSNSFSTFWMKQGLAITEDVIHTHTNYKHLAFALTEAVCLYNDDSVHRRWHYLSHGGTVVRAIILHENIALDLGFKRHDPILKNESVES